MDGVRTQFRGERGRPSQERGGSVLVGAGIATTLILHGAIVGLVIWGTMRSDEHIEENTQEKMLKFEDVKLLSLGEKKPENQLPRIANPPAPTPKQETVSLEQKEKKEENDEPEEKTQQKTKRPPDQNAEENDAQEREKAMDEAFESLHDPNRPTNTDVPEGSKKGVAGGTISDEAMANLLGTYQAKLLRVLSDSLQVPTTIPDEKLAKLFGEVVVYVRLSKDGDVVTFRFLNSSSNSQVNGAIRRLLRRFEVSGGGHTLPLPTKTGVRQAVLEQGLRLQNWQVTVK